MNKIFKIVWSQATRTWVVTSELSKAKGKSATTKTIVGAALLGMSLAAAAVEMTEVNGLDAALSEKADQAYVENQLGLKADQATVNTALNLKADKDAVDAALALKADQATVDTALNLKADKSAVDAALDLKADKSTVDAAIEQSATQADEKLAEATKYFKVNSEKDAAEAIGTDSIAVGPAAKANSDASIAMGDEALVGEESEGAIALGQKASVGNKSEAAIAIGQDAMVKDEAKDAIAIGTKSKGLGEAAVAIGAEASAQANAVALGKNAKAQDSGAALGLNADASEGSVALGANAKTAGFAATALGNKANASGDNAIAIGNGARAAGDAIANTNQVLGASIALGHDAQANVQESIAIGVGAGVGTGASVKTDEISNVAIGTRAGRDGTGGFNVALGNEAGNKVNGQWNTAMGFFAGNDVEGNSNVAIGKNANKDGGKFSDTVAIGVDTAATKSNALAIGNTAQAHGLGSIALGRSSISEGDLGLSLGAFSSSKGDSVALGAHSSTANYVNPMAAFLTGTAAPASVVSIGSDSTQRRLINVADGANLQDAVTVNQLKREQAQLANMVGGGLTLNEEKGTYQFAYEHNGVTYSSITAALKAMDSAPITGENNNLAVVYSGSDAAQVVILNGTNGATISNLADGKTDHDAVNVKQLREAVDSKMLSYVSIKSDVAANKNNNGAEGVNSLAIGPSASTVANEGVALGYGAMAGKNADGSNTGAIALGSHSSAKGTKSLAVGYEAEALEQSGMAMGLEAKSYSVGGLAMGHGAKVGQGESSGKDATDGVAIGTNALTTRAQAVALGYKAQALADNSFAQGTSAKTEGQSTIAMGHKAYSNGEKSTSIGAGSYTNGINEIAMGTNAYTNATNGTAIGNSARSTAISSIAMGDHAAGSAESSIALGTKALGSADSGIAIGKNAQASYIGLTDAEKEAMRKKGDSEEKIQAAEVIKSQTHTIAIGSNAKATAKNSIALGVDSVTLDVYQESTAAYSKEKNNGAENGVISIGRQADEKGENAIYRRMTNLAGGQDDNDAVNVLQLRTVHDKLTADGMNFTGNTGALAHRDLGQTMAITGGMAKDTAADKTSGENLITRMTDEGLSIEMAKEAKFTSVTTGGTVMNNNGLTINGGLSITVGGINMGGKQITNMGSAGDLTDPNNVKNAVNVGDLNTAITGSENKLTKRGLNFAGNTGEAAHRDLGQTMAITGGMAKDTAADKTSGENLITRMTDEGLSIEMAKEAKFTSVTTGDTVMNNNGLTINGGPSITVGGINMGGKQITNMGSAGDLTDPNNVKNAVNVGDLNTAITGSETTLTKLGLNFVGNTGEAAHRDLGQTMAITGGMAKDTAADKTSGENLITRMTDEGLSIEMAKEAKFTSVTTGGTVMNNNGLTIAGGPSITVGGINMGGKQITDMGSAGDLTDPNNVKNAVNVGDLNTAITGSENTLTKLGLNFAGNTGEEAHRDLGQTMAITGGMAKDTAADKTSGENLITRMTDEGLSIEMAKEAKFTSVTTGNSVLNNTGLTVLNKDSTGNVIDGTSITHGNIVLNSGNNELNLDAKAGTLTGLTNKTLDAADFGTVGRAATEEQLVLSRTETVGEITKKGMEFGANDLSKSGNKVVHRDLGQQLDIVGGMQPGALDEEGKLKETSGENLITLAEVDDKGNAKIKIEMAKKVKFDSVDAGDIYVSNLHSQGKNPINVFGGLNITNGGFSVGSGNAIDMGKNQVTNVAAGTERDHAVNLGQLDDAIDKLKWHLVDGSAKPGDGNDGAIVRPGEGAGNGTGNGNGTGTGNGNNTGSQPGTPGGNTIVMKGENNIKVTVDKDTNTVTIGTAGNGAISEGSGDVITGGQVYEVASEIAKNTRDIIGGKTKVMNNTRDGKVQHEVEFNMAGGAQYTINDAMTAIDNSAVHYDKKADGSVDKSKVTLGEKGTEVTVGNVAAGVKDNDAVNVSQLKGAVTKIDNQFLEVNQNVGKLAKKVDDIDKDSRAGVAAAMAAAALPQAYLPGKSMMSMAGSTWRGETGYAIGVSTISDNGNWVVKANMTGNARSQYGAAAGVGYQW